MAGFSLLLPQRCASCDRPGDALCERCRRALVRLVPPWCERCGAPGAWPVERCAECSGRRLAFATARAAIVYDEGARRLVRNWKEHGRRDLSELAADVVTDVVPRTSAQALVPVPADRERGLRRGHAPALGLARALGRRWGRPVVPVLRRVRPAARQRGLNPATRRRNVAGVFAPGEPSPPYVCLVDDVYTTGATAAACAAALRRGGATRVEVVAFARALR